MEQVMSDPRRRRLGILGAVAAFLVIWAIFALWQQNSQVPAQYAPTPMFPELAHHAREAARIHIVAKSGSFDVVDKPSKGWVISSRGDFPASFEQVNRTVIGLANMETLEPRTARPDWLHFLGLDSPPKGDGVLISVYDTEGSALASIIAGKSEAIGDRNGANGLFVRKPDSTQSWLARSTLEPNSDVTAWYEKNLLDIDHGRIAQTEIAPPGAPAYTVRRDKPSDTDFKVVNLPAGQKLPFPSAADSVGTAIAGLTFDDVKPAKQFDFSKGWRVVTQTFDGLTVTLQLIKQGQDTWTMISAQGTGKAAREAQAISARTSGWAYKLPQFKANQLMTTLDAMLKPPAAPQPPAGSGSTPADSDDSSEPQ